MDPVFYDIALPSGMPGLVSKIAMEREVNRK